VTAATAATAMASASSTAATAAMTAATATTPSAFPLRTRLVNHQRAAHKLPTVERSDYFFSFGVVLDLRESKTARLPGKAIAKESE
jgi:hypothetical protein